MKKITLTFVLAAAIILCAPVSRAQDTIDSIEKAVVEKFDKLTSMTATVSGAADVKLKPDQPTPLHVLGNGSMAYAKKDNKTFSRFELIAGLTPQAKLARLLAVLDGQNAYLETEFFGKTESKKIDQPIATGGKALFDLLKQNLNLTALPSEKVDGKDTYALAGTLKEAGSDIPLSKIQLNFDKETGVIVKFTGFDKQNAPMVTLAASEIKLNQPIPDDRFKYTPPPPPAPPAAAPAPAGAAPKTPAPAAAPAAPKK